MKAILAVIVSLFLSTITSAFTYGEHKEIGDKAFSRFVRSLKDTEKSALFISYADAVQDAEGRYYFSYFSVEGGNRISYGVLNGLSGDHQSTPLELEVQLRLKNSLTQRIIFLHNQYIAMGYTAAPDGKLVKMDFGYALQAAVNLSHFYEYKHTFQQQLRYFNKDLITQCEDPALAEDAFNKLGRTNAINMYVTIHTLAVDLAEQSGRLIHTNEQQARQLLRYAVLYNSFADHFLEDSFSAGHLVVNRTVLASVTNNKALHDFYSENGTTVLNRNGEIWKAYGDGQFNNRHESWQQYHSLQDIAYTDYNKDSERVIEAIHLSLQDVWNAFQRSSSDSAYTPFLQTIPDDAERQPIFLIDAFPSLRLVPIPYNSQLDTLFPGSAITDSMKSANQRLTYREFVRSRFGNSFVLGVNSKLTSQSDFEGFEFRINAGNIGKKYAYNAQGGKKGVSDYWNGYTASYTIGSIGVKEKGVLQTKRVHQLRGGIRSNFDHWLSDKRFLGLYSYTEAGVQFVDGKGEFIFVPSVGLQLGSLLRVNYYNMPGWLRIPTEYILPLKLRVGTVISQHEPPKFFSGADVDFVF